MASDKACTLQDPVLVNLYREDWETVLQWLQYGTAYHMAKKAEVLANCKDHRMAAQLVAGHETAAAQAETVWKIIEDALIPALPPETE